MRKGKKRSLKTLWENIINTTEISDLMITEIGGTTFKIIELMRPLSLDLKVYPGDPKPRREVFSRFNETGYEHYVHSIGDHNFQPHGDAPRHQNDDDRGVEYWSQEYYFNKAVMVDLSEVGDTERRGIRYRLAVEKGDIKPFACYLYEVGALIIRTGYDRWLEENYPHKPKEIPYLTEEAARYIEGFEKLKVIGIDSITVDPCGVGEVQTAHQTLREKLIVEAMVNLHKIPPESRINFYLQTVPLKIEGATGGAVVALAFIKKNSQNWL